MIQNMTTKTYKFNEHFYYRLEKHQCIPSSPVHSIYRRILSISGLSVLLETEEGFELVELKGAVTPIVGLKNGYIDANDQRFSYLIKPNKKTLIIYFRAFPDTKPKMIIEFFDYIQGDSGLFFSDINSFIESTYSQSL